MEVEFRLPGNCGTLWRMNVLRTMICVAIVLVARGAAQNVPTPQAPSPHGQVHALKVTILSTMLADRGIGEWGFAALVEVDGKKLLFDTGARPDTGRENT